MFFAVIFLTNALKDVNSPISGLIIIIVLIIGIFIIYQAFKNFKIDAKKRYEEDLKNWNLKWFCNRCGFIFIPVDNKQLSKNENTTTQVIQEASFDNLSYNYIVKIKELDDPKKVYLIAKEFYKDAGVNFNKAKELLMSGTDLKFTNKDEALKIVEKYRSLGCVIKLDEQ